jgi:TP901 family phage tail tape measure protein
MADDSYDVEFNAKENVSDIVRKMARAVESFSEDMGELVYQLEDAVEAQEKFAASVQKAESSTKKQDAQIKKSVRRIGELKKALKEYGISGAESLKVSDVFKGSAADITEFKKRLEQTGDTLSNFIERGAIDFDLGDAIDDVNKLRKALEESEVEPGEFLNTEQAQADIERLKGVFEEIFVSIRSAKSVDFGLEKANNDLKTFYNTLVDVQNVRNEAAPSENDVNLASFAEVEQAAQKQLIVLERLRQKVVEVGKEVSSGSTWKVGEFNRLRESLRGAEKEAAELGVSLRNSLEFAPQKLAPINQQLKSLGFRQITLNDIFPSEELQKVNQLNETIQREVRDAVQEGATAESLRDLGFQVNNVDQNVVRLASHLPRLRYAIYDVSNTATVAGTALLGISLASFKIAADFERNFADVQRVTNLSTEEAKALEGALIDVSKSIPVGFADLTQIATLAGQLNIAEQNIANFTETVAKFSATTDVTIDAAATAFGRLDQLVEGVDGQFDKLASSILAVGVNAVATESDIIAITTQIASVANIAGFSASELIGFSSALASVGTRPELARGTFTRLFTEIQQSVGSGSEQLNEFAKVAGRSVEDFRNAWTSGEGVDVVISILEGLEREGQNADRALAKLGITSVRDVPTLLKLAQGVESVKEQIAIANIGFIAGTELQDQYGIITATLSEKIVVLRNNFEALIASLGGLTGPVTFVVDLLIKLVDTLEAITRSPVIGTVTGIGLAFGATIGVVLLAVGAFARLIGSYAGAATSLIELRTTIAVAKLAMADMTATTELDTAAKLRNASAAELQAQALRDVAIASGLDAGAKKKGAIGRIAGLGGDVFALSGAPKALGKLAKFATRFALPLFAAVTAIELLDQQFEIFGERVKKTEKDIGPFLSAAEADTKAWREATGDLKDSFTLLEVGVNGAKSEISDYVKLVVAGEGGQEELKGLIDETTGALETQTIAIGENTKALVRRQLAQDILEASQITGLGGALTNIGTSGPELRKNEALNALVDIIVESDLNERLVELGFNYEDFANKVAEGSVDAANAIADSLAPAAAELADQLEEKNAEKYAAEIAGLRKIALNGTAALKRYSTSGLEVQEALQKARVAAILAGEGFIEQEEAVESAQEALDAWRVSFNQTFGSNVNATTNLYDSLGDIDSAIQENGKSFNALSADGVANLLVLQTATFSIIKSAEGLGLSTAQAIAIVFQQLVNSGIDVATSFALAAQAASAVGIEVTGVDQLTSLLQNLSIDFDSVGDSARGASREVKTFEEVASDLVNSLFESINATRAVEDSIFALGEAFGEAGNESLYASEEIQNAISAILNSSGDGQTAVANLSALFVKLANTVGSQSDPSLQVLRQTINAVAQEFGVTNAEVERFIKLGGGELANINVDNFARGAQSAAKEMRTLLDYAGDLDQIFSRSFDIRFKSVLTMDDITESWADLNEQVDEVTQTIAELSADRSLKEYFLSVAEAYGDTLRADVIRAELADVEKEISEAQDSISRELVGDSRAARENRRTITDLVGQYQDYIVALAESGASQSELQEAVDDARRDFQEQARELGFSEQAIQEYGAAFDDVTTAIERVPRNITVEANVDPAIQALNEMNAALERNIEAARRLNTELGKPSGGGGNGGGSGLGPVGETSARLAAANQAEVKAATSAVNSWQSRVNSLQSTISSGYGFGGANLKPELAFAQSQLKVSREELNALRLFSMGGFTGRGGRMDPAGIVHKGEYVVPKQYVNQSTGLPDASFLAQLQNGMRGYQMGGFVGGGGMAPGDTMMVELSPYDRKLLQDAGNVQLRVNGRILAETTNTSNFNEARRGSN